MLLLKTNKKIQKTHRCEYVSLFLEKETDKKIIKSGVDYLKTDELKDYIGTVDDEQILRQINTALKKTLGLWIYKKENDEDIRCLCTKCLNGYIQSPDYIVRRLDPFAKVKSHCDKCGELGWDYVVIEKQPKK